MYIFGPTPSDGPWDGWAGESDTGMVRGVCVSDQGKQPEVDRMQLDESSVLHIIDVG